MQVQNLIKTKKKCKLHIALKENFINLDLRQVTEDSDLTPLKIWVRDINYCLCNHICTHKSLLEGSKKIPLFSKNPLVHISIVTNHDMSDFKVSFSSTGSIHI